jgi:hypothetical protein
MNIIASKDKLTIYESDKKYYIMDNETKKISELGNGADRFVRMDGSVVPPGTAEFEMIYQRYLDIYYDEFAEEYLGCGA